MPTMLAERIVRARWWVAGAWTLAALFLLPRARQVEERLDVAARVEGSESADVERTLAERFGSPFARYAVLVLSGVPAPTTDAGRAVLERAAAAVAVVPGVTRTFSYLDAPDPMFVGDGGARAGTFLVAGLDARAGGARAPDALVAPLRRTTSRLTDSLRSTYPGAELAWTGEIPLNVDLRRTSAADGERAERRVLPLTLALLLVAFGALAAALLPVAAGGLAIALSLGAAALAAAWWPLSILLQNVVSMLGLGLGIDYALLMVSRFREARARGLGAEDAAAEAARTAGHTILLSGAAVAVGFAGLLAVPLNEMRSVAAGGLIVVTVSVLLATTLLPGVLAWLGARVDAGRLPGRRRAGHSSGGAGAGNLWRRWGRWVAAHPGLVLALAAPPLLALAAQARRLETRLPRGDWLPPAMESARGLHALRDMGRSGVVQAIRVVVEMPAGSRALDDAGWAATRRLGETLAADPRVARVRSLPALAGLDAPSPTLLSLIPADVLRTFVSRDGRLALLEVMPREATSPGELSALVRELRTAGGERLTGVRGAAVRVGGMPAFNADYEDAVARRAPLVVGLILAGTFLALCVGFRSLLVPLKAVLLNLLSVGAAFGAVVLVFQDGHGARLLGLSGALDGVFPAVPLLVFCIVFGLSMDYEVFLVARVAEARRAAGTSEGEALAEGMARTGGVITSAALIMVVVFAAFTLGGFVLMKILGFALAVAVLLDVTVVRAAVGPALLALAGRWNWWPGERAVDRGLETGVVEMKSSSVTPRIGAGMVLALSLGAVPSAGAQWRVVPSGVSRAAALPVAEAAVWREESSRSFAGARYPGLVKYMLVGAGIGASVTVVATAVTCCDYCLCGIESLWLAPITVPTGAAVAILGGFLVYSVVHIRDWPAPPPPAPRDDTRRPGLSRYMLIGATAGAAAGAALSLDRCDGCSAAPALMQNVPLGAVAGAVGGALTYAVRQRVRPTPNRGR